MLANWITLSRLPLLLISVLIMYRGTPTLQVAGAAVLLIGLMLDTVDGVVARKTGKTSLFGSVLDIAADRAYELVLWISFAHLRLLPVAIPLIVIARTTLTDAFRSIEIGEGTAPFAQHRTGLGRFLVASTWMRVGYTVSKTTTFCGLALAHAFGGFPAGTALHEAVAPMLSVFAATAWVAVGFCLARGLPVLVHAGRRYWGGAPAVGATAGR